jgi:hypothetical protein
MTSRQAHPNQSLRNQITFRQLAYLCPFNFREQCRVDNINIQRLYISI